MMDKENTPYDFHDKIESELEQYSVRYPDEYKIDETINTLRQYVPSKKTRISVFFDSFTKLLNYSKSEVLFIRKSYWLISIALFVIGYLITYYASYNPVATLGILAPIPFVFGLLEVFKGRDQGLLEMEMSCKFSASEVMLTRLLLVSVFSLILNTLLTVTFAPLITTINLYRVILLWLTPFTIFNAIALWVSVKARGSVVIMTLIPLWTIFSVLIITDPVWGQLILGMHIGLHILLMAIGVFMFALQIKKMIKKYSYYEEAEIIGISN